MSIFKFEKTGGGGKIPVHWAKSGKLTGTLGKIGEINWYFGTKTQKLTLFGEIFENFSLKMQ